MMTNLTIPQAITGACMSAKDCSEWCMSQHFSFSHAYIWLFVVATVVMAGAFALDHGIRKGFILPEEKTERFKYQMMFFRFALGLMVTGLAIFAYTAR